MCKNHLHSRVLILMCVSLIIIVFEYCKLHKKKHFQANQFHMYTVTEPRFFFCRQDSIVQHCIYRHLKKQVIKHVPLTVRKVLFYCLVICICKFVIVYSI